MSEELYNKNIINYKINSIKQNKKVKKYFTCCPCSSK